MAIVTKPLLERLNPLVDLKIHQIAVKHFHYNETAAFPYNLLIMVFENEGKSEDFFLNMETNYKIPLELGHIYLLPCNLPVKFKRTPQVAGITMRFNMSFFYGMDIFDGCRKIEDRHNPKLVSRIRDLVCEETTDAIKTTFELKAAVMEFCLECWPEGMSELNPEIWKYERVLRYAREYCNAELTVGDLAEIHDSRQDVFSRAFSRDLGIAPKKYIADQLAKRISIQLLTTNFSIKEIAHQLKFSSEYYLSRFFKKHSGLPPGEYRNIFV